MMLSLCGLRADQLQEICSSFDWASDRSLRPNLWRSDMSFEFILIHFGMQVLPDWVIASDAEI